MHCEMEMPMYSPEEAAGLCSVSIREIYRRIERDELHFTEMPDGTLLICSHFLFGN